MTSIREIQDGTAPAANCGGDAGGGHRLVEFRFYRKDLVMVWVAGEFTDWKGKRLAMERLDDGWWVLTVPLAPGDYRFRYLADEAGREKWFTDFASHGVEYAGGQWNSVVVVPTVRKRADSAVTHRGTERTLTAPAARPASTEHGVTLAA